MNSQCYLCGSTKNKTVFIEHSIPILQCFDCSHVFSSYEQEEHYDGYWGEGKEESFDLDWWDVSHRAVYKEFITNFLTSTSGSLLDVGCGLGFFVKTDVIIATSPQFFTAISGHWLSFFKRNLTIKLQIIFFKSYNRIWLFAVNSSGTNIKYFTF